LSFDVMGSAGRATHWMRRDQRTGQVHQSRNVRKTLDHDADRRDSNRLDGPLNVSDRHVANRSKRNKQSKVNIVIK